MATGYPQLITNGLISEDFIFKPFFCKILEQLLVQKRMEG